MNTVAKVMEQGGAGVAVSAWIVSAIRFLDGHSPAVLAACGICGVLISAAGFLVGSVYRHMEYKRGQKSD